MMPEFNLYKELMAGEQEMLRNETGSEAKLCWTLNMGKGKC